MLSDDQESCMSPNSQDLGQITLTDISPQPPSITDDEIAPGQFSSAINMLLDEVLLEIFACHVEESEKRDAWRTLACVCRRWRSIAFGSPRRLNLRIFYTNITTWKKISMRKNLDFWPPFPILLTAECSFYGELGKDNVFATLEHHNRVSHIKIWNASSILEKILSLMQKPFPMLTDLELRNSGRKKMLAVVPDSFLDGSATQLRNLRLERIPFPGLPNLLLSATHLVHIELYHIPDSGYFAPEALVTCLPTLTRLQSLLLWFDLPRPRPELERRRTSSSTRALRLLPSLTRFVFRGDSEYLEDIVDSLDAPQLSCLRIKLFHQLIFDTPRLAQFISRIPKVKISDEARMCICDRFSDTKVLSSKTITNKSFSASFSLEIYELPYS